jgi:peptidoglycan/LPS O-acetylase OafA/YrhL
MTIVRPSRDMDRAETPTGVPVEVPSVSGAHRYMPALDGLRALAIGGVIAYHYNFHWANGGYLGVDFFFVLSGFLITSLLASEWTATRGIALRSFWARRAKRLLPAVILLLLVLTAYDWLGGPNITTMTFRPDAIATLFYYANWHLILTHQSYFTQFQLPSPLKHTWSLAIEEQFYIVWPLIALAMFRLFKRRRARSRPVPSRRAAFPRRAALVVTMTLAAASALEMALLYHRGADTSRIYYGTDTRAFELLIGATLALAVTNRPDHSPGTRRLLHIAGPTAAVALAYLWVSAGDAQGNPSGWMYQGGLVVAGLLAAVVIASVAQPDAGPLGAVLSNHPLRWIGGISYGLYLWHWPTYVLMTDVTTGLSGATLVAARLSATLFAAVASFYLIERPIRRYRWKGWPFAVTTVSAVGVTALAIVVGTAPATTAAASPPDYASVRVVSPTAQPHPLPPPILLPPGQHLSPASPLRVITIGDSVMVDAELGIAAALQATGEATVSTHSFPGWGLTTDTTFAKDLTTLVQQTHAQLIIAMWSWDDNYAAAHPKRYRHLMNQFVTAMLAPQNGVDGIAFVQFPKVGALDAIIDPNVRQGVVTLEARHARAWAAIVKPLPKDHPGRVTYLPVASSLDVDGRYSAWLPTVSGSWIRARKTDNTHLCPAGAAVLGAAITQQLTPMFGLAPPAPGWINKSWTSDTYRYDVPAGECPNDQPSPAP